MEKFIRKNIKISEVYEKYTELFDTEIKICGWIRSSRTAQAGRLGFIDLADGSTSDMINIVFDTSLPNFDEIIKEMTTGCSISCIGLLVKSPDGCKQRFELKALDLTITGKIPNADEYPIPKIQLTNQYLRDYCHLRPRTRLFGTIFRIRDSLITGMRDYFTTHKYIQVDPNILTISDCEGAGETFTCTTLIKDDKIEYKDGKIDFAQDTFGRQVNLTVSSQLHLEAFCCSLGDVYTMNKSFRGEKSLTNKHVSEFMHVEAELAFIDFGELMAMTEDFTKHSIRYVLEHSRPDLEFIDSVNKGTLEKVLKYVDKDFDKITYIDAVELIRSDYTSGVTMLITDDKFKKLNKKKQEELIQQNKVIDRVPEIGEDLSSAHEKYLIQKHDNFVFVTHWPHEIKAFYMKESDKVNTHGIKLCESFDLLCPDVGELFGGSMREDSYEKLTTEMTKRHMDTKVLEWYLDLRKYGSMPHGGWGCGFDRLLMFLTGTDNIKDVIPIPVYYTSCKY